TPSLEQMKAETLISTNPIAAWADLCLVEVPDNNIYVGSASKSLDFFLYASYHSYCLENGFKPLNNGRFSKLLHDLLVNQLKINTKRGRDKKGSYFTNLGIRSSFDSEKLLITKEYSADEGDEGKVTVGMTVETPIGDSGEGDEGKLHNKSFQTLSPPPDLVSTDKPIDPVLIDKANDSVITDKANDSVITDKANDSVITDKANDSVITDKANNSVITDKANDSVITDKANNSVITDKANDSVITDKANDSVITDKANNSVITDKANDSVITDKANNTPVSGNSETVIKNQDVPSPPSPPTPTKVSAVTPTVTPPSSDAVALAKRDQDLWKA
ncbi:hypothetical protein VB715_19610, partial [Crocosphaera sp. UHCC 0190]|nr:hypothetical protein [Crocosphaera sp. UHCC 0190]